MSDRSTTIEVRLCDADIDLIVERLVSRLAQATPAPEADDEFLTTGQAAALLQVSESHLEGLRSRGGGPRYLKIGGRRVRYRRSDLLRWMSANVRSNTAKGA